MWLPKLQKNQTKNTRHLVLLRSTLNLKSDVLTGTKPGLFKNGIAAKNTQKCKRKNRFGHTTTQLMI